MNPNATLSGLASFLDLRSGASLAWIRPVCCVGCLMLGFLASYLGGAFQRQAWYDDTPKPKLWPPQWVFPLVWVGNYTLLGLALAELWRRRQQPGGRRALALFALNFGQNLAFIPIVYRARLRRVYVLMDSLATVLTLATTIASARVAPQAAWLLTPYVGWSLLYDGHQRGVVAHRILVAAYYMLREQVPYREPGAPPADEQRTARLLGRMLKRIEQLGYTVSLEPVDAVAA